MHVLHNQAPRPTALPGIAHITLAGQEQGLKQLSLWQQSLAPGAATPPHRHDVEEAVVCLDGEGELHIDGKVEKFATNSTLLIPAGVDHQIFCVGHCALHMIAVFASTPVAAYFPDGNAIDLPWRT